MFHILPPTISSFPSNKRMDYLSIFCKRHFWINFTVHSCINHICNIYELTALESNLYNVVKPIWTNLLARLWMYRISIHSQNMWSDHVQTDGWGHICLRPKQSLIQPSVHKCDTSTVSILVFANADLSRQNKKRLIALYILAIVSYIILNG